jgi:NADH:ubiquinone reductase (H+-translocating)
MSNPRSPDKESVLAELPAEKRTVSTSPAARPRVVIVGAGFGGVEAARALRHTDVEITLIDRRNFHLFQPLLYQVATASLSPGDIAWPIRSIFRGQANVTVLMAEITGVDVVERTVTDGTTVLPYDFLVLATGATFSYFGREEWAPFAPGLKTIADATTVRQRLLTVFERAELEAATGDKGGHLTIAIVGGGPTGVEMAGAVAELSQRTLSNEFRNIEPAKARIVLIEAGPRLLPAFPEKLSEVARRSLEAMKVEVRTNAPVTACDAQGVVAGGERIEADTVVWAAGVSASPAAAWLDAPHDRAGRVEVEGDLSVPGHPMIFAIGDTARTPSADGRQVAPVAKQMGHYVGKLIAARIAGRRAQRPFVYHNAGDLATIGRKSAIVSLPRLTLTGFVGWLFWCLAHIWFLADFRSRAVVTFEWAWNYLTYQRAARLISDRRRGGNRAGLRAS